MYACDKGSKRAKVRHKLGNGMLIPKLMDYKGLMKFIKSIDIGRVRPLLYESITDDNDPDVVSQIGKTISGCSIDLEERLIQ